ncbi:MAG: hypothetical protein HQL90_12115 [Magnetococcales bacterium]|nr:hypothetical protein [Magnetococcales bacterium]
MATQQSTPPRPDEIEVSVFGPGFGESVVVHLGYGEWIIVDSCAGKDANHPKPIEYLVSIGQNPEQCVRVVVATHWHSDHVVGLVEALDVCRQAIFCCSDVLSKDDFIKWASLYQEVPGTPRGSPGKIGQAIEIAGRRSNEQERGMLKFAKADMVIWQSAAARLVALSPSDEMNRRALAFIAHEYACAIERRAIPEKLPSVTPNDTAVVLRVDAGERSVLLGSDLERGQTPLVGWSSVLNACMATEKKSSVYKVAHHGAESGWHDDVWSEMLINNPFALLTPFRHGNHRLPTTEDRARILAMTDRAFIASHPDKSVGKRMPKVEELMRRTTIRRREASDTAGLVRWRAPLHELTDDGRIELFDGAKRLS